MFVKDNLGLTFFDRVRLKFLLKKVLTHKKISSII